MAETPAPAFGAIIIGDELLSGRRHQVLTAVSLSAPNGKLVCVAGMTPTKAGEGKTTRLCQSIIDNLPPDATGYVLLGHSADAFANVMSEVAHRNGLRFKIDRNGIIVLRDHSDRRLRLMFEKDLKPQPAAHFLWIDDADALSREDVIEFCQVWFWIVLITARPGPTLAEMERSWAAQAELEEARKRVQAEADRRTGELKLAQMLAEGRAESIEGIDPEAFGRTLREFKGGQDA